MRSHRSTLFLPLVALACAGAPSGTKAPSSAPAVVKVPPAERDARDDPADPAVARAPARSDTGDCIPELRDAAGVAASDEERRLYFEGLTAEREGRPMDARKRMFELVQRHPTSGLIPLAYLAFGEMFAAEAASDPSRWALADAAYREVLKYPPPANSAFALARLRSAEAVRSTDPTRALGDFSSAHRAAREHAGQPCGEYVARIALQRMVDVYAEAGQPEKAWAFFRAQAGEQPAASLLLALARLYRAAGKTAEACRALSAVPPTPATAQLAAEKQQACSSVP